VFETGLRIGEAIEARFGDVDFGGRWLAVDRQFYGGTVRAPKGRKRRRVRLHEDLARELWRLRGETRSDDDQLLFTAERGGRLVPSNIMSRVLKPAAVRAGLGQWVGKPARAESWVGFHTLRHSRATELFRAGWNAKQVQMFLGHSDPGFTLRTYVHLLPEDMPEPPAFAVQGATAGATQATETGRDAESATVAAMAV
jgi:integrase